MNSADKETIRAEMWWELANKYIFEDFIEPKKKQVQHCNEHLRMSKDFEKYVWKRISDQKLGYRTPRIPYLLDAFFFEGKRIPLNDNYNGLEDQIYFYSSNCCVKKGFQSNAMNVVLRKIILKITYR